MNRSLTLFAIAFASVCALGTAFTPVSSRSASFQPARVVAAANNRLSNKRIFRMSEEPTETEAAKAKVDADGSFYDDEVSVHYSCDVSVKSFLVAHITGLAF
jgi:hypothetical protein